MLKHFFRFAAVIMVLLIAFLGTETISTDENTYPLNTQYSVTTVLSSTTVTKEEIAQHISEMSTKLNEPILLVKTDSQNLAHGLIMSIILVLRLRNIKMSKISHGLLLIAQEKYIPITLRSIKP